VSALHFIQAPATGRRAVRLLEDEVLLAQFWFLRDDHRTLNCIFELAHVAHPGLLLELIHGCRRNARNMLIHRERKLAHEMLDQ